MDSISPQGEGDQLDSIHLATLLEVERTFNSSLEIDEVLNAVMDKVIELMKAERGFIMLLEKENQLVVKVARNIEKHTIKSEDFKVSSNIIQKVVKEKKPILSSNAMDDPRFDSFGSVSLHSIRSILCIPMINKERVIGVIYVDNRVKTGVFKKGDLQLLSAISYHAATAVENARLYGNLKNAVKALANAIEARDTYTRGHVERVCRYSLEIANELHLSKHDLNEIEISSILHDVGKIGVPDTILKKPGPFTPEEREIMEKHTIQGKAIVEPIDLSQKVKDGILYHQERYDGNGYPNKLKGEDIPLFARILGVADAYDAMRSDRPYRKKLPREVAIAELKKYNGIQFDPVIVEAFMRVLQRNSTD
ncbi:MAG: HD domain-containing phosphohydrolase [Candidatus Eremiobacteraeota bacterium]|nr:HD domain-containing phosphohydrolase [Candidatus Eremiobacteraeota bacterium]